MILILPSCSINFYQTQNLKFIPALIINNNRPNFSLEFQSPKLRPLGSFSYLGIYLSIFSLFRLHLQYIFKIIFALLSIHSL